MAIDAKLTRAELSLYEILRHPAWCSSFLRNEDISEEGEPWELTSYQVEMLCDHGTYVSLCCGRSVGKSETILDKTTWYMLNNFYPNDPVAIVTPNRVHLDPLFTKLRRWLSQHSFLSHYVGRQGINSANSNITAKNGFQLDCRIAGVGGTGANVLGLHTPIIMLDEAGVFPWSTWIELPPTHNTWQPGAQLFVSGVPTGQRERNVLYFADQTDTNFSRFNISQHANPRYSEADESRNLKQFGGTAGEDYIHIVLGRHGTPVYSLFDRAKMYIQSYDVFVSKIYGNKLKANPMLLGDLLRMMPMPPTNISQVAFGIDLGYTEPSVILILYKSKERWRILARLILYQVNYNTQQDFIARLSRKYDPDFIGIDAGGPGKAVVQNLVNDDRYTRSKLYEKVISIDFNSSIHVGYDDKGDELKERAKIFGMQRLQELTNLHTICYSSADNDVIVELERTMYSRSPSGNIIYKTLTERGGKYGDDHNVAALLSFVLSLYYKYDIHNYRRRRKKLWKSRWM